MPNGIWQLQLLVPLPQLSRREPVFGPSLDSGKSPKIGRFGPKMARLHQGRPWLRPQLGGLFGMAIGFAHQRPRQGWHGAIGVVS